MTITERTVGDVVILDLVDRLTYGEAEEQLHETIQNLISRGVKKLVLNMAEVPYVQVAGLAEIVRSATAIARQGGTLKLLNITEQFTKILSFTKLLIIFETYDDEAAAVESFKPKAAGDPPLLSLGPGDDMV